MIRAINSEEGLVAVDTCTGFSIFEQTGLDFEIDDFVSWSPERPSSACEVRNVSRGRTSRVYFQNHGVPETLLKANLKL